MEIDILSVVEYSTGLSNLALPNASRKDLPVRRLHATLRDCFYVLMNIECDQETLDELDHAFKFNDAILRHLTIKMDGPVKNPSPMMREEKPKAAAPATEEGREKTARPAELAS